MTISHILEHWATIYKPLSHKPEGDRLDIKSFFRIRFIDMENIFSRNANLIHSPCMLQSVTGTGEIVSANQAEMSYQVWFLQKIKDTDLSLGRFDGVRLEQTAADLREYCEDLIAWLIEVKRTGKCPVTGRMFKEDPQLSAELQSIEIPTFSYGVLPDIYSGQWLIAGLDWKTVKPLYKFDCNQQGKYLTPDKPLP